MEVQFPAHSAIAVQLQEEEDVYTLQIKGETVGEATLFFGGGEVDIDNIDIYPEHQGKGYGTAIVRFLASLPQIQRITGSSVPEALPFWTKLGAVLHEEELQRFLRYSGEDPYPELITFRIQCEAALDIPRHHQPKEPV